MKTMMSKFNLIFIFSFFLCQNNFAQADLKQPNLRIYLSEDKNSYVGALFVNQIWTRYIWNNPDALGNDMGADFDVALRRSRAIFYVSLYDKVFMYTQFGADGLSYSALGNPSVSLYNAETEYAFVKEKFHLGFGLTTWNGLSRYNNGRLTEYLVVDNPGFAYPLAGRSDRFGRQLGVYAKGTLGKLHYRSAIVKPFQSGVSESSSPLQITERLNDNFAYKSYFSWQFFDKEATLMPYMTMNNLGRAKILNLGAGFYYHPQAMIRPASNGYDYPDIFLFALDAFWDLPLNNGAAVTAYLSYNNYDFGTNFLRSNAPINPALATSSIALRQGIGNSEWEIGTGQIIRGEFGYLLPGKGMKNRFQPYGAFSIKGFQALSGTSAQADIGVNWLMVGHNLKWTLQYSTRPIYTLEGMSLMWTSNKGQIILQTQIFF